MKKDDESFEEIFSDISKIPKRKGYPHAFLLGIKSNSSMRSAMGVSSQSTKVIFLLNGQKFSLI